MERGAQHHPGRLVLPDRGVDRLLSRIGGGIVLRGARFHPPVDRRPRSRGAGSRDLRWLCRGQRRRRPLARPGSRSARRPPRRDRLRPRRGLSRQRRGQRRHSRYQSQWQCPARLRRAFFALCGGTGRVLLRPRLEPQRHRRCARGRPRTRFALPAGPAGRPRLRPAAPARRLVCGGGTAQGQGHS